MFNHSRARQWTAAVIISLVMFAVHIHLLRADSIVVPAARAVAIQIYVHKGLTIEFEFTVSGERDDIDFYVLDSTENQILRAGRVAGHYSGQVPTSETGWYTLVFDNTFSTRTAKNISLKFHVTGPQVVTVRTADWWSLEPRHSPTSEALLLPVSLVLATLAIVVLVATLIQSWRRTGVFSVPPSPMTQAPPRVAFCRYCGADIPEESAFCDRCGMSLRT